MRVRVDVVALAAIAFGASLATPAVASSPHVAGGAEHAIAASHSTLFIDNPHNARRRERPAPSDAGRMINFNDGISAIPGTSDVVAVGDTQTRGVSAMAIRRHGHWVQQRLPFPHFHPVGVVALTVHDIRIAGTHFGGRYEPFPMVVRWNGTRFASERLPETRAWDTEDDGQGYLESVSASGRDDIWAGGDLYGYQRPKPHEASVALHYDGTKWSRTVLPEPLTNITVSSPTNAFAVALIQRMYRGVDVGVDHWDGTSWSRVYSEYRRETITAVATSGAKRAYAIGTYRGRLEVMHYRPAATGNDEKRWPTVHLPASLPKPAQLHPVAVTMKGRSVWVLVETRPNNRRERRGFILHSNGGALTVQQTLEWPDILRTLDASGRHVIAAGRTADGKNPIVDRLKGSTWHVKVVST